MSAVYIVTAGGYADYRIVAVFSTEELAKVHIEKGQLERACVERYDLDPQANGEASPTSVCATTGARSTSPPNWCMNKVPVITFFGLPRHHARRRWRRKLQPIPKPRLSNRPMQSGYG